MNRLLFHAYTVWLFTLSDLKTIVIPQTIFGVASALALSSEGGHGLNWAKVLARVPMVVLVIWINLLPFTIDNQRQPTAVVEDRLNKPWRPMPSGRMTGAQAKALMFTLYAAAFCVSWCLGGTRQCVALMVLGYGYNDVNLADWSCISRNAVNALGFCCFASAASEVALDVPLSGQHVDMLKWHAMVAAVVFSTVQTQDLADQPGDRARGRRSLPLTIGDGAARWLTAGPLVFWSVICPLYWHLCTVLRLLVAGLGLAVVCNMLAFRSVEADGTTFRLWNAWMACLYALPLLALF